MLKNPFDIGFEYLPTTLPIFPLSGILLLPAGQVPLNIFEPRYVNMTQDALAAHDRFVGLVIPRNKTGISGKKPLYDTGCAGRITSFEETADGRFLITLTGYCRFDLKDEIPTVRGYRRVEADWSKYEEDLSIELNPKINRDKLLELLQRYLQELAIDMDWTAVEQTPNFNLVTFFSMSLPFNDKDKQALLEAIDITERANVLSSLIEIALVAKGK